MVDIKNGFYRLDEDSQLRYKSLITKLSTNVSGSVGPIKIGDMVKTLRSIETVKAKAMARVARETLSKKGRKVILIVNYMDTTKFLMEELQEFNPVEINGRVSIQNRVNNIAKFNEPNDDTRIIIVNLQSYYGIDLSDTTESFPRYTFIMPSYNQEIIRTNGIIRFFYGMSDASDVSEKWIVNALAMKALTRTHGPLEISDIVMKAHLPMLYDDEYEDSKLNLVDIAINYIIRNNIKVANITDDLIEKIKSC